MLCEWPDALPPVGDGSYQVSSPVQKLPLLYWISHFHATLALASFFPGALSLPLVLVPWRTP